MLKIVVSRFDNSQNWRDGDKARGRIEGVRTDRGDPPVTFKNLGGGYVSEKSSFVFLTRENRGRKTLVTFQKNEGSDLS